MESEIGEGEEDDVPMGEGEDGRAMMPDKPGKNKGRQYHQNPQIPPKSSGKQDYGGFYEY